MSDLKPCPFCGNENSLMSGEMAEGSYSLQPGFVFCCECGAEISECKTEAEAVEAWNRRAEPEWRWIPVTEKLPEDKDWYLGIFKESDTGYCISIPFVCYYAGRKTRITTKDYWILRGYDDIYSFSEYFRNLECEAWMPLPEPWRGE